MKRTVKETSNEIPGWLRLLLASFCLAAFVCGARFVPSTFESGAFRLDKSGRLDKSSDEVAFSSEAPACYLNSSLAFEDVDAYLDGRGRRFGYDSSAIDSSSSGGVIVVASHNANETFWEKPIKSDEFASTEPQGADFADDFADFDADFDSENEVLVADLSDSREATEVPGENVSNFSGLQISESPTKGWEEDELNCEFEDLSRQWGSSQNVKSSDKFAYDGADIDGSDFGGADFDDEFDRSLVTDDLFHTSSTTAFVGQTNATSGGIAQVSAETPAQPASQPTPQPKRSGRYIPQGAVGGSGDVVVQIK